MTEYCYECEYAYQCGDDFYCDCIENGDYGDCPMMDEQADNDIYSIDDIEFQKI